MEFDRLDFVDAIEELASHCGMEVVREENNASPAEKKRQQQLHHQKSTVTHCLRHAPPLPEHRHRVSVPAFRQHQGV